MKGFALGLALNSIRLVDEASEAIKVRLKGGVWGGVDLRLRRHAKHTHTWGFHHRSISLFSFSMNRLIRHFV